MCGATFIYIYIFPDDKNQPNTKIKMGRRDERLDSKCTQSTRYHFTVVCAIQTREDKTREEEEKVGDEKIPKPSTC